MPLSEKARIEVYLPDGPQPAYRELLEALEREFTHTFGGSTIIGGLDGSYLSLQGIQIRDRINLLYTDIPFPLEQNLESVARYADQLRSTAFEALEEEAVLIAVLSIFHVE